MIKIKAYIKLILFGVITILVILPQYILLLFYRGKYSYILPFLWQKIICIIFNIKVRATGNPYTKSHVIYVSNHISYLDIPVIGSIVRASFVAKQDVESWPVFGFLSQLQQTAFISREREHIRKAKDDLDIMLNVGKNLIIFPEGTSTDGREVREFKSSLFSIAMKENLKDIYIQPITLKMDMVDNKPVNTQEDRDIYSWHINMEMPLGEHLWNFALSRGAEISVNFHDPIKAHNFSDRKELAKACYNQVSSGLK